LKPIISRLAQRLTTAPLSSGDKPPTMFAFFSNRLGCLGSIAISVIGTIILIVLMRGCQM
jgi:hypothetical protein